MPLTRQSIIKKKEDVVCESLGHEAVLLNLKTGDYFTLNGTGRMLWAILDEESVLAGIFKKAAAHFVIPPDQIEKDITVFFEELGRLNLCVATVQQAIVHDS